MAAGLKSQVVFCVALLCVGCASTPPQDPARPTQGITAPQAAGVIDLAADGAPVVAHWKPLDDSRRPAVVALHGCGGLYQRDGRTMDGRYPRYVERLHRAAYHVLLPDSFTRRGMPSICTVRNNERTITVEARRADVVAAVHWLAHQPNVDPGRIVLLGWSHGAMTTLNSINSARPGFAAPLAGAVAFYPGCSGLLRRPFKLDIPVLMLLAEKDDWTPPARCVELADRTRAGDPKVDLTVRVYPDSYHGFDGTAAVRYWTDVANGVDPSGVHLGANPAARTAAQAEMDQFLARVLK
jgi:dienelactone hydrolase